MIIMKKIQILDSFWIRIIAIVTMVIDHIAVALCASFILENTSTLYLVLRVIGRISFPLYALGIYEGVTHTKNIKKYLLRLFIMFLMVTLGIAFVNYVLKIELGVDGNIFTTLFLGALLIYLLRLKNKYSLLAIIVCVFIIILQFPFIPNCIAPEYGLYGIGLILLYYLGSEVAEMQSKFKSENLGIDFASYKLTTFYQEDKNIMNIVAIIFINLIFYIVSILFPQFYTNYEMVIQSFSVISIIFLLMYNGNRGYSAKWFRVFNYIFYPLHLIIIFGIILLI